MINKPSVKPNPERVRFSFQHLQADHPKFPISDCTKEYFEALFRELRKIETWTMDLFRELPNGEKRHPIYFPETTEPEGFPNLDPAEEDLWTDEPWQFGLPGERGTPSGGWRVHGFIAGGTFYIVWLDPRHKLDSPNPKYTSNQT